MKSLSEPAITFISRRELLYRYFREHAVPDMPPDGTLTIKVDVAGILDAGKDILVTYSYDEVMHVLGEMKLKGIPFETTEEVRRRRDEQVRKEIAAHKWRRDMMQRVDKEVAELGMLSVGEEPKNLGRSFWTRAASKLFGAL